MDESPYEASFDAFGDVVAEDILPIVPGSVSVATQNPELAPIIAVMQKALDNGADRHISHLYRRGRREYVRHKFIAELTPEERQYVYAYSKYGGNEPILMGMEYDNYPI